MTTAPAPTSAEEVGVLPRHVEVLVVGSGFAGIGAAVRLLESGVRDLVVLERGEDVGGTWRDNTYPGAACDVPSQLYSFSFAPNPAWSRSFSTQPEIQAYLQGVADRWGVRPHLRTRTTMQRASWDDAAAQWVVETDAGTLRCDVLVSAVGGLSEPRPPDIEGLEDFAGTVFHSARWDHGHDLAGERVAVIGTGASAIQFLPHVADRAAGVHLFQRTAPWVLPRVDRALPRAERALYRRVPALQRLARGGVYASRELLVPALTRHRGLLRVPQLLAEAHLRRQVPDPELRRRLRPDYTIGCKRMLISNDYYPVLSRPTVELVTDRITRFTRTGVVTADEVEREVDTVVLGTGFHVTDLPVAHQYVGRDGRTMAEVFGPSPAAYLGATVPGFPNLFMLVGPNTGLGHTSMVYMIESQVAYVVDAVRTLRERRLASVEVRPEALERWKSELDDAMHGTVWTEGGCSSWYLDSTGRNSTLWPTHTWRFRRRTRRFDADSYVLRAAPGENPSTDLPVSSPTDVPVGV